MKLINNVQLKAILCVHHYNAQEYVQDLVPDLNIITVESYKYKISHNMCRSSSFQ